MADVTVNTTSTDTREPDPVATEVQTALQSPVTARVLKSLVTWILGAHDSPIMRRMSTIVYAGVVWVSTQLGTPVDPHSTAAVVQRITEWILGSGAIIAMLLHLVYDRVEPRLHAWVDKYLPPVQKKV